MPELTRPPRRTAANRAHACPFSRKPTFPPAIPCVTSFIDRVLATNILQRTDIAARALTPNFPLGRTILYLNETKYLTTPEKPSIGTAPTEAQNETLSLRRSTPYIIENTPLTATLETPVGPAATQTQTKSLSLRRSTPYIAENKPLTTTPKTLTPPTWVTSPTRCREILPVTVSTPHPRTLNRPLIHNCAISPTIRFSDINGRISNPNHINTSRSSSLILWSWPPSCNPQ